MAIIKAFNGMLSLTASGKLGSGGAYGINSYGWSQYGASYPAYRVYRTYSRGGKVKTSLIMYKYNDTSIDPSVRLCWPVLRQAVLNWQGFTEAQKKVYNKKARGLHMSGYNLYIKNYIKQNY